MLFFKPDNICLDIGPEPCSWKGTFMTWGVSFSDLETRVLFSSLVFAQPLRGGGGDNQGEGVLTALALRRVRGV